MQFLTEKISNTSALKPIFDTVTGEGSSPVAAFGVSDSVKSILVSAVAEKSKKTVIFLTETEAEARKLNEDAISLGQKTAVYPARDFNFLNTFSASKEYEHQRISALWKLICGKLDILFLDIEAFSQKTISIKSIKENSFKISVGQEINLKKLTQNLLNMGYDFTEQVDGMGQFSVRGGIIDFFSPNNEYPVRIELWGDEVDSIAFFESQDQRRKEQIEEVTVVPATEFFDSSETLADKLQNIIGKKTSKNENFIKNVMGDIDTLKSGGNINFDKYMELLEYPAQYFLDYAIDQVLFINETANVFSRLKNIVKSAEEERKELFEKGIFYKNTGEFYSDKSKLEELINLTSTIYLDSFTSSSYSVPPKKIANVFIKHLSAWSGAIDVLIEDIQPAIKNNQTVIVLAGSPKSAEIVIGQLESNGINSIYTLPDEKITGQGVFVMPIALSAGFEIPEENILVISHRPLKFSTKKSKRKNKGEAFNSLDELKVGDYVVHYAHGIGVFDGIHRIETGNVVKDYIKIKYKGTDVLYVPVTQLDLVSRYIGGAGEKGPLLHRLGSSEWQKAKTRVRTAVRDMAKELIRLYGKRLKEKGYAFMEDNELQADFEAQFPFEETEDQLRAIDEIKADMQKPTPMDRLLCGDVGFGKTEVALRAAFKCIQEGKQCAILVPTTILAWQHFLTATERFGELPVKIEMLSRFRTKKQIEGVVKGLARGDVDLVIGTHRMISNDVKFRDLGLVIIDEEQRFGVAQKEKLKTMFTGVDVLTLTATPIPRTLNMAMSGIRDMSSIEEAPQDRQPVQTYVMEQNNGVLIEAINKELRRGGQVYYLHNRVESIAHCAARLATAIPNAKIALAHGKMGEEELSKVWKDLLDGEIDILVCTTIIETGVDVPNCNTLIIEDADRMGLAQLHQIRGRVGRSSRRAYAYFCFKRGKALSEIATKRLEAIREYTEFGSGFKIAMRDLEIRGAGNILGGEQHGHMDSVGYDMYIKLLNEAIGEEKTGQKANTIECTVDLDISANIPEKYIPSLSHRLSIYRRIADIKTLEDKGDVIDELVDRFGEPPEEVLGLIDIALLKGAAERNGIYEISSDRHQINLYFKADSPEKISELVKKLGQGTLLVPTEPMHFAVKLKPGQNQTRILKEIADRL